MRNVRRVLVVDDDEVIRALLEAQLAGAGNRVRTAETGDAALALMQEPGAERPDVVLCDLQMPGKSGEALARGLRAVVEDDCVLLAMSASEADEAMWRGFDGFLMKPFTLAGLSEAVERGGADRGSGWGQRSGSGPCLDEGVYAQLAGSMRAEQVEQLYALCVRDVEERIGRMRRAGAEGDDAGFRAEAHAIKGGCGMVGAAELQSLATSMETRGLEANHLASLEELLAGCGRLRRILVARQSNTNGRY